MSDNDNNGQSDTDEQLSGKQSQSEYNDSDNDVQIDSGNESSMESESETPSWVITPRIVTDSRGNKIWRCPICSRQCHTSMQWHNHKRTHQNGRYRCTYNKCGKTFKRKDALNSHVKYFHEKQYFRKCDICKSRYTKSGWQTHSKGKCFPH